MAANQRVAPMTKDDRDTLRQLQQKTVTGPRDIKVARNHRDYYWFTGEEMINREAAQLEADYDIALRTHATDLIDAHERLEQVREWARLAAALPVYDDYDRSRQASAERVLAILEGSPVNGAT